jgi:uncharacterized protein (TIGR02145 family)
MRKINCVNSIWIALTAVITLSLVPMLANAQKQGTFKDTRDGHVYYWVKIGNQSWMSENLRFIVPVVSWAYDNDSSIEAKFGRMYTWTAAQTACPKGWHLPSDKDWNVLIQSLGGQDLAGQKMQSLDSVGAAYDETVAIRKSTVSSLLGGVRHPDGTYSGLNFWGGCWSSGKINDSVGSNVLFVHGTKEIGISTNNKNAGFTVRCVRK